MLNGPLGFSFSTVIDTAKVFKTLRLGTPAGAKHTARWTVPADLPYFDGHFPGFPIFPGVGIVDASLYLLGQIAGLSDLAAPKSLPSGKFLNPVLPETQVRIELEPLESGAWRVEWTEETSAKVLASLRIQL